MQGNVEIRLNITSPLTPSRPPHSAAPSQPAAVIIIIIIIIFFFVEMCRCYGNGSCFSDFRVVCLIIRALVSLSVALFHSLLLSLSHFSIPCIPIDHFWYLTYPPFFLILGFLHSPWVLPPFPIPILCSALTAVTLLSSYLSYFVVFRLVSPVVCCYQTYFRCDSPWLIDNMTKPRLSSTCSKIPRDKFDPIDICGPAWRLRLCWLL